LAGNLADYLIPTATDLERGSSKAYKTPLIKPV
jgi:hypothetical protein